MGPTVDRRSTHPFTIHFPWRVWHRWGWIALLTLCLALLLPVWVPVPAQEVQSAYVELDGYQLFKIWSSAEYSAEQRVHSANSILEDVVQSAEPATIKIVELNQLPVNQG